MADRSTQLLEGAAATPLGLPYDKSRPEAREVMPARSTLLLYTDGLIERRREPLDKGIRRATDLVQDNRDTALEGLADEIMSRLTPRDGYQDDVALLLYRQPAPLEVEIAADPSELAPTRAALRGWLTRAGLDSEQTLDVLIAVGEAVANSIEHGHREHLEGTVSLRATAVADRLHLTVVDTGSWKTPTLDPNSHRGRGIALMRALMQDVSIEPSETGTTIHMHTRIA
jgi:anti-sigma regulatory factor (Ser/Thr protein kinase)